MDILYADPDRKVEALAAREGLAMIVERGLSNVISECDSSQIANPLRGHSPTRSMIGLIIEDAKASMSSITGVVLAPVRCQANEMAHQLAKFALSCDGLRSWFEEPPDFLAYPFVIDEPISYYIFYPILSMFW
ncbi:hypothetical protein COP2_019337 [Malus domestica]